jgi:signal transduction histidine kinase/HAMP domain-containing protein/ActR/RegA family two-component response regulator
MHHPTDVSHPHDDPSAHEPKKHRRRDGHDRTDERLHALRDALRAARQGDFTVRLPVDTSDDGVMTEVMLAFNGLAEENDLFVRELARVTRTVGTLGMTSDRAALDAAPGAWAHGVASVNALIERMAWPVVEATAILELVASGDLSHDMSLRTDGAALSGDFLELGRTVKVLVSRLRTVSSGVSRVVREMGIEGKLGGQASVEGLSGTWKDLVDDVNQLAGNLTAQVRPIALVTTAVANGDLSKKVTVEAKGEILELKNTVNGMVEQLRTFAGEVTRVAREVGTEGKLGAQADVKGVSGTWKDLTDSVNMLAGNLTAQVRNIALVTTAVANGNLSKKITVEAKGEIQELKDTINAMVEQLRIFAAEVTRVAREVGTEGQLGGQADVPGVSGTWKDLTDSVNLMASNLTDQVRGIGKVVTSVAGGDLTKKLVLVAKGEIAALADTINDMTETLRTFAEQVTTVAREVGIEGRLGGQAKVPGAAGTWRHLTDNVNQLAANLTTQVRSISEVASAVIEGDLTRSITVETRGEVLGLKDTINQMITNLRDTTRSNKEQDWLKTNLARFFGVMQGQRNLQSLTDQIMSELTPVVGAQHGAFYLAETDGDAPVLTLTSTYAHTRRKALSNRFRLGEGIVGQSARERKPILVTDVPEDYIEIASGLGQARPKNIAVVPVLFEDQVRAVIELASFHEFTPVQLAFLEQLTLSIGLAMNLIGTSTRTEQLLQQLQGSNVELDKRRRELEDRAQQLESRNREIAQASASLEAKSQELARVSQYKSQFLTNMSHEIRTPLNSMMILAQMLSANEEHRLSDKQQEWATTIHSAGRDLLALINQILDLSKVEAGRIEMHVEPCSIRALAEFVERTFRPVAIQRGLELSVDIAAGTPATVLTDRQLLEQILKNLLANACKFTEHGRVELRIERGRPKTWKSAALARAPSVIELVVVDTGIGIPFDQQERIFEAFQQADPSITRRYGGTGLGLTISREYARLLGGEIVVQSTPGSGSAFTLVLPLFTSEGGGAAPPPPAVTTPESNEPPPAAPSSARSLFGTLPPEEAAALDGRKVLVVEDDARNMYAVAAVLERFKVKVIAASNAREAFAKLREHPDVGVVLMDVMMPEMDGYRATREIHAMPDFAELPVVALTAKASESDRAQCLDAGCADYMVKPADTRQLVAVIAQNLRPRRAAS